MKPSVLSKVDVNLEVQTLRNTKQCVSHWGLGRPGPVASHRVKCLRKIPLSFSSISLWLVQLSLRGPFGPAPGEPCPAALHLCGPPWLITQLLDELGRLSTSFPLSVFINSLSWESPTVFCVVSNSSVQAIECLNLAINIDVARSKLFFTSPLAFLDVSVPQTKPVFVLKFRVCF